MEMGRTGETPDEGYTAGSKTIRFGGFSIRHAAAEARQAILELASERLGVVVGELSTRDGSVFVTADPRRRLSYAELVGGRKFDRRIGGRAATKSPSDYRLVGTDVPRTELPGKFMGAGSYIHDLRLPGMVHARVVRPPSAGAELVSLDEESAGTARVVRLGSFVAVVAEREETAIEAARALQVEWRETRTLPRPEEIHSFDLRCIPLERGDQGGAVEDPLNPVGRAGERIGVQEIPLDLLDVQPFERSSIHAPHEHPNRMASFEQLPYEDVAEVPRGTGYKDSHSLSITDMGHLCEVRVAGPGSAMRAFIYRRGERPSRREVAGRLPFARSFAFCSDSEIG